MPDLISLPDELRLHIFEYVFCDLVIKLRAPTTQRTTRQKVSKEHAHASSVTSSSTALALFTVSKAFANDGILHKALRSGATITLTTVNDIDQLHSSLKSYQVSDIQHFTFEWKRRSVCPKGRVGKAIDTFIEELRTKFPATATLQLRTNPFEICLQHPTIEDMEFMSDYSNKHDTSVRYTDDCGNKASVDLLVYREFHCCSNCIKHHVNAVKTGVEITFQLRIRPGYSFGRPGVQAGPCQIQMSTRNYILRIRDDTGALHYIPQRSFHDIQNHPPTNEQESDFFYSFTKSGGTTTRFIKTGNGSLLRRYDEGNTWRAG